MADSIIVGASIIIAALILASAGTPRRGGYRAPKGDLGSPPRYGSAVRPMAPPPRDPSAPYPVRPAR